MCYFVYFFHYFLILCTCVISKFNYVKILEICDCINSSCSGHGHEYQSDMIIIQYGNTEKVEGGAAMNKLTLSFTPNVFTYNRQHHALSNG